MVCLSPAHFRMSPIFVDNAMNRLLSLYESKSKAVNSTAKAALMQLFSHVISDLVSANPSASDSHSVEEVKQTRNSEPDGTPSKALTLSICTKLLKGIATHLNPEKDTEWPVQVTTSTTCLALDLLSLVISEGKEKLGAFEEIMEVLKGVFEPLVSQISSMKSDFGISIRLVS